jgi:hypothetical protein
MILRPFIKFSNPVSFLFGPHFIFLYIFLDQELRQCFEPIYYLVSYMTSELVIKFLEDHVFSTFSYLFYSLQYHLILNWHNPSRPIIALGSTQPIIEMSTRNLPGDKGRPACKAENLTTNLWTDCLENVGASMSHNPMGFRGLLQE